VGLLGFKAHGVFKDVALDFAPFLPIYNFRVILMTWEVLLGSQAQVFLDGLSQNERLEVLGSIQVLRTYGPNLGRPYADVIVASRHRNMKELRVKSGYKQFRIFFAFDPKRRAILLTGGDKISFSGSIDAFYERFISEADALFDDHLRECDESPSGAQSGKGRKKRSQNSGRKR